MKNKLLDFLSLLFLPIFLASCMTVAGRQDNYKDVRFESNVTGTVVNCNDKKVETPGVLTLQVSKDYVCSAEKSGYGKKVFIVDSGITLKRFAISTGTNFLAWGWWTGGVGLIIGWIVDAFSGAMKDIKENVVYINLTK